MRRIPIVQGDHCVTNEPGIVISTLLGSCIAVCLQDPIARVGGMNHFLLSEPASGNMPENEQQRYGVHAMELLINALMRQGAMRQRLRAHLYGGANIIAGLGSIGTRNAAFARQFMQTEGIAVGRCELGGTRARKVEFMPYEGRVRSSVVADAPPPILTMTPAAIPNGDVELF